MTDTTDEDDIGSGLFGRTPPDLQPLVEILRSGSPLSQGIRNMLADMIDPKSDGYLYLRLELKSVEGKIRNAGRDIQNQKILAQHTELVRSGKSANQAAQEIGQKFGLDQRSVWTRLGEAKRLRGWLKGSSDGTGEN